MKIRPIILAGGSGKRLWPLSRERYPKPFLNIEKKYSFLQETILRLENIPSLMSPIVVCNEEHRFLVSDHLKDINCNPAKIILEPTGRNTAPALTLAAMYCMSISDNDDEVLLALPADHSISDTSDYCKALISGCTVVEKNGIVTFGIVPTSIETGYGYLKMGPKQDGPQPGILKEFLEKPNRALASEMIAAGDYFWNSGIFGMKPSIWLEKIRHYEPEIFRSCRDAIQAGSSDNDFFRPHAETFKQCISKSIDYAVMEKIPHEKNAEPNYWILPMNVGWSDVGTWASLWKHSVKDDAGNLFVGDPYTIDVKNSLIISTHRTIAAAGLENTIVVETADAILIANQDKEDKLKDLLNKFDQDHQDLKLHHHKVHRPWGTYEILDSTQNFQVKKLVVNPNQSLSLQKHSHRAEHWVVVKGQAHITRGDDHLVLYENQSAYIPVGIKHRLENLDETPLEIIEVQSGDYFGEDDIVRYEDKYNR